MKTKLLWLLGFFGIAALCVKVASGLAQKSPEDDHKPFYSQLTSGDNSTELPDVTDTPKEISSLFPKFSTLKSTIVTTIATTPKGDVFYEDDGDNEIEPDEDEVKKITNELIDTLIDTTLNLTEIQEKINPVRVPDINKKRYRITNGKIYGVGSLHRIGDAFMERDDKNGRSIINATLGLKDLRFSLDYRLKFLMLWYGGHVEGKMDKFVVDMVLYLPEMKAATFSVSHVGGFSLTEVTGATFLFNWVLRLIANVYIKVCESQIKGIIEGLIGNALNQQMNIMRNLR